MDKTDEVSADGKEKIGNTVIGAITESSIPDEYVINAATVKDGTLRVNVSYSGGCETHEFTLVAEERFMESFPVQLRVSLAHNTNGDTCQEPLTEVYRFDLTPIKEMYQKGYQTDTGTIVLRLKGAPPSDLTYEF